MYAFDTEYNTSGCLLNSAEKIIDLKLEGEMVSGPLPSNFFARAKNLKTLRLINLPKLSGRLPVGIANILKVNIKGNTPVK